MSSIKIGPLRNLQAAIISFALSICVSVIDGEEPWRTFRGPDGSGVAASDQVVMELDQSSNMVWLFHIFTLAL